MIKVARAPLKNMISIQGLAGVGCGAYTRRMSGKLYALNLCALQRCNLTHFTDINAND
jgi:hypothetical protein